MPKDEQGGRYQSLIPINKRKEIEGNEYMHKLNNYDLDGISNKHNSMKKLPATVSKSK